MVGQNRLPKERKRDWLSALLKSSFGYCEDHQDLKFNEKNVFCIDCALSLCRHCKEAHSLHGRFQIYKYSYQDVVRHSDLQKYFDCSSIQTYISNNERIVHLRPRPSSKVIKLTKRSKFANLSPESQTKVSTQPKSGGTCEECGKHLQDERNRFCSITCKISVLPVEPQNQSLPIHGLADLSIKKNHHSQRISEEPVNQIDNQNSETESSISIAEPYECVEVMNFRKRPRKATPHRSPSVFTT